LEDARGSYQRIQMDQADLGCTGVHSWQKHRSQGSQAGQYSGKLNNEFSGYGIFRFLFGGDQWDMGYLDQIKQDIKYK